MTNLRDRSERGPQNNWLHLGKADSPSCPCRAKQQSTHHVVIECPTFETIRTEFLGHKHTWEELDKANWRKVGGADDIWYFEVVFAFGHMYGAMTGRSATQTGETSRKGRISLTCGWPAAVGGGGGLRWPARGEDHLCYISLGRAFLKKRPGVTSRARCGGGDIYCTQIAVAAVG